MPAIFTTSVNDARGTVEIHFASTRLEHNLSSQQQRVRAYGSAAATKILLRLSQLHAAPDLEAARALPGRCHELHGDRKGQLAITVSGGLRLVFEPVKHPPPQRPDGGLDWGAVTVIRILEVTNYHDD